MVQVVSFFLFLFLLIPSAGIPADKTRSSGFPVSLFDETTNQSFTDPLSKISLSIPSTFLMEKNEGETIIFKGVTDAGKNIWVRVFTRKMEKGASEEYLYNYSMNMFQNNHAKPLAKKKAHAYTAEDDARANADEEFSRWISIWANGYLMNMRITAPFGWMEQNREFVDKLFSLIKVN